MAEALKQISCSPDCGFMVRSHDEEEVVKMGMKHVQDMHPDMKVTEDEMRMRMTDAPAI